MHFSRLLSEREARASQGKVRLLFGPRQTGKTMLLECSIRGIHRIGLGAAQRGLLVCRTPRRQQLSERVVAIPWEDL